MLEHLRSIVMLTGRVYEQSRLALHKVRLRQLGLLALLLTAALTSLGCQRKERSPASGAPASARSGTPEAKNVTSPATAASSSPVSVLSGVERPTQCPKGMVRLPGGDFWVGSEPGERFSDDETPRYLTRLAPFCLDVTEVTVSAYAACVERGACTKVEKKRTLCNEGRLDRPEHPMNCVTFHQADAFCRALGARLPTEAEWEYGARGGSASLTYPWGEGSPDGRACWKHVGTCAVKTFAPGAFGLFDMTGNVWEWTSTFYGAYPWPPESGFSRVYRGGSFSRRFEKWMRTRLRNRAAPADSGSHLGLRCALSLPGEPCPFGQGDQGACRHGVLSRSCPDREQFNGIRCAGEGEPRCRPGRVEKEGFGCVLEEPEVPAARDVEAEAKTVRRERSPEFDHDCSAHRPTQKRAFRYAGGTHDARNLVSRKDGCNNRDVGVGWNSTCCP